MPSFVLLTRGEEEVSTTKVHDLETSRFELRDSQDILEVLVENIEQSVGESPEEEERDDQAEREDQGPSREVAACNSRGTEHSTTRHGCCC